MKILQKLESYLVYAVLLLVPFLALPISPNPFVVTKLVLASFLIILYIVVFAARVITTGSLKFNFGKFDLAVVVLTLAYVASTILRTPNKMEAILLPGTATAVVLGAFLYLAINQLTESGRQNAKMYLLISAGVFSLMSLLSFVGLTATMSFLPSFVRSKTFTPDGGYLPAAIFLFVTTLLGAQVIVSKSNYIQKVVTGASLVVVILGLLVSIFNLLPGKPTEIKLPSYNTSWNVAVDSLKESPLLGIGPGNYLSAFNRYRPVTYNNTELWAVKFSTARSFYMTLVTETGLVGLGGMVLLFLVSYRSVRKLLSGKNDVSEYLTAGLLTAAVLIPLIFPLTPLMILILFAILAFTTKVKEGQLNLTMSSSEEGMSSRMPAIIITVPLLLIVILYALNAPRIIRAEYRFNKGVTALTQNKAQETFDNIVAAIQINPMVDRYHATFARIALVAANSVAQQNQENVTEQVRNDIARLVQQAIAESKAAVSLNPFRADHWNNLGATYQSIMPLAQGSDQFAIQSYRQAVVLDPINPNQRLALGSIYYAQKDFENAQRVYELAVAAKPDYANARYNLAFAMSENGQIDQAIEQMTIVLSLVDQSSQDYEAARAALEQLQEKKAVETPEQTENLTPPQEADEPILEPQLDLPEGSEPPEEVITPTPEEGAEEVSTTTTPSITPTPTP